LHSNRDTTPKGGEAVTGDLLISIVTPSFNEGPFIAETLDSVVGQDYKNIEYIVIDGASTDRSVEIIGRYAERLSYWESTPDRGQSHAINKGFEHAHGPILTWLNAGDYYLPGALASVADCFRAHPEADLVYGNFVYVDRRGGVVRRRNVFRHLSYDTLLFHDYLGQPAVFFRRSLLDKVGPVDEGLHYHMDWDLFLRMWKVCTPVHLPRFLAAYRLQHDAKSNAEDTLEYTQGSHLVQRRHMVRRFRSDSLNAIWLRWLFFRSLLFRVASVVRDNPFAYIRTLRQMFPGRRMLRLWYYRLRPPN
jgi:glycosyltransferase involved in cell wall biosynthesis